MFWRFFFVVVLMVDSKIMKGGVCSRMRRWKSIWHHLNSGIFKPLMAVTAPVRPWQYWKGEFPNSRLLKGRSPGSSIYLHQSPFHTFPRLFAWTRIPTAISSEFRKRLLCLPPKCIQYLCFFSRLSLDSMQGLGRIYILRIHLFLSCNIRANYQDFEIPPCINVWFYPPGNIFLLVFKHKSNPVSDSQWKPKDPESSPSEGQIRFKR